jgi:hypothetical protein
MHEHTEECDHDKEVGRTTQNVVHPFAMIDWEPAPGIETVPDDSSINGRFTRFEKHVIAKKNYAWDDWSKIRGYVPRRMHDIIRSMWEGYWKSAAMGPEPFETVMALVRRKIGLPYDDEKLHQLRNTDDEAVQDEQEEQAVSEVHEDGTEGDGPEELGEVDEPVQEE